MPPGPGTASPNRPWGTGWLWRKGIIAPWGTVLSQNAGKYAIIDLGQAAEQWGDYRRRVKADQRPGRRVGFPCFKRRRHEQGFWADNGPGTVRMDGKAVFLPKIGGSRWWSNCGSVVPSGR